MSLTKYSLFSLLGTILGVLLLMVFHRPSRHHRLKHGCMAIAIAAALTLWRHFMGEVSYGLFLLPLFGGLGAGLGNVGGEFLERLTREGDAKTG